MPQPPPMPVAIENAETSANLNSTILFTFLMGAFTVVYFGTLYAYLTKNGSQRRLIIATITSIYVISVFQLGIQWWAMEWQFVKNGETRDSIFNSIFAVPAWFVVINTLNPSLVIILADGLLIWRCFHVCNGSYRIMALPFLLWAGEICLSLAIFVLIGLYSSYLVTEEQATTLNGLLAASNFVSAVTTLAVTILISYRIYSIGHQNVGSVRRFKHILEIVIESSAVYAVSTVVGAIVEIFSLGVTFNTRIFAATSYGNAAEFVISGMAPTIMVARVALLAPEDTDPSTAPHLSGLQFHRRSATNNEAQTMSRLSSIVAAEHDKSSADTEKNPIV